MRRLIINADDFGLTRGVNAAILRGATQGVVTSCTLMANGVALHDAVAQLSSLPPGFSVGCHLSLVDGQPTSDPSRVRTLLDGSNEFRRTIGKFAFAASSGKLDAQEIEREASAQFQRLLDSGVQLSHFDAHKHAHMFPQVLEPVGCRPPRS